MMDMKRSISGMVGKGSLNHNSRKFHAGNTDPKRSHLNICYCDRDIREVYHELFDAALERYNAKQTRTDRKIEDYYEKIRFGKQEKPFHEVILQIGNWEDTAVESKEGALAVKALDEYMHTFQTRNPNLHVFSAHLHMDEATPHLHIDFVPYVKTDGKRGLDTRVSLKQALKTQGFVGTHKKDSEWSRWIQSEKENLAAIMERHGIEWEHKGVEKPHLDVLDYKLQERKQELAEVEAAVQEKTMEVDALEQRIETLMQAERVIPSTMQALEKDPTYQLPEPAAMMTAKAYKTKIVEPLFSRLKSLVVDALKKYYQMANELERWRTGKGSLYKEIAELRDMVDKLWDENKRLKRDMKDYKKVRRTLGEDKVRELLDGLKQGKRTDRRTFERD